MKSGIRITKIHLTLIILVWVIYEILGNVNKKIHKVDQRLKNLAKIVQTWLILNQK